MNLIFIYGPPATGKLTIATELSKLTGYSLFHNHLTRDLVQSIYPGHVTEHYDLVDLLRADVLTYCARNKTNLIFTFVYDGPSDDDVVADRVNNIVSNGGKVFFVELKAPHEILLERVSNDSRKQHQKLTDETHLAALLNENAYSSVQYDDILRIDTSNVLPADAAKLIADHFKL